MTRELWLRTTACFFVGGAMTLFAALLLKEGSSSGSSWLMGAIAVQMLWIPLFGLCWLDNVCFGITELLVALAGSSAVLLALSSYAPVGLVSVFWAQTLVFATGMVVIAVAVLVVAVSKRIVSGRMAGTVFLIIVISNPFWSKAVISLLAGHPLRQLLRSIMAWTAPLAVLSTAMPQFHFHLKPQMYNLWFGSMVPLPAHPGLAVIAYLLFASLVGSLAWVIRSYRTD